ncbi:DUF4139 domain-containing protein [soil metagenome]
MTSLSRLLCSLALVPLCTASAADSSLTIYNDDFAVVRGTVPLELKAGITEVRFNDITAHLEPSSVILRDPAGKVPFQVLEQNYRADPVSQGMMLSLFEGQTIDFRTTEDRKTLIVQGKVSRSGYQRGEENSNRDTGQPLIEVNGKLQFELPGLPLFPRLADDTILKPELNWRISSAQGGRVEAEIAYVTAKLSWSADYNVVAPEAGNPLQITGWVTINNESGKRFENVQTKLVAGDVKKVQKSLPVTVYSARAMDAPQEGAPVTERSFDEYHLYALPRPVTLRDQETKQIEFIRAEGVQSARRYIFDALGYGSMPPNFGGQPMLDPGFYTGDNKKVAVVLEFENKETNQLGMPLPKGRWRFYRRDIDQQLEFTGENEIDHTAKDETIRVLTGHAFDLVGERRRTNFAVNNPKRTAEESFEIKLRNRKKEPVEIVVREHLSRWSSWEITAHSEQFTKKDAQTIEFLVPLKPDEEKVVSYTVRYVNLPQPPL